MPATAADRDHFEALTHRMVKCGGVPIALYGAGHFVEALRPTMHAPAGALLGIIDDSPAKQGRTWAGLPVISGAQAIERGARAVVITAANAAQEALWSKRRRFLDAGLRVFAVPRRFPRRDWDACLGDFYELMLAREWGLNPVYPHAYPSETARARTEIIELAQEHFKRGGTVCEIGPGYGMWTEHLIERAGVYHAVDYSAAILYELIEHRFAKHLDKLKLHHDERAMLAGVPDASVDLVFSYDVFVHFKMDLVHQFMASIRRVLKPGGAALVHFGQWNPTAIDVWETQHLDCHGGGTTNIHYAPLDYVQQSGRRLGLDVQKTGPDYGWTWMALMRRA